jgi:hypothetical protein
LWKHKVRESLVVAKTLVGGIDHRIIRDLQISQTFDSSFIVKIFGIVTSESIVLMEFLPNGSLAAALTWLSASVENRIILSVIKDLEFLHVRNLAHGGVKTANVLIDESGAVKLSDFRSSCQKVETADGEVTLENDIWSYGMLLRELLRDSNAINVKVTSIMEACLESCRHKRPTAREIVHEFESLGWQVVPAANTANVRTWIEGSEPEANILYREGLALSRSTGEATKAADLLKRSAELGHADGNAAYGELFENGRGVPREPKPASFYYHRSVSLGSAWGLAGVGSLSLDNGDVSGGFRLSIQSADAEVRKVSWLPLGVSCRVLELGKIFDKVSNSTSKRLQWGGREVCLI